MKRPNTLLVVTDQQQGQVTERSSPVHLPNLRRLANEGVQFDRAYTCCAVCSPARASLYSSYYPHQHGVLTVVHSRPAITLLNHRPMRYFTHELREQGYLQSLVGRWHVTADEDPSVGRYDTVIKTDDYKRWLGELGIDPTHPDSLRDRVFVRRPGWNDWVLSAQVAHDELLFDGWVGDRGVQELGRLCDQDRPWHLTVGFFGPHDPYMCPERIERMYPTDEIPRPPGYDEDPTGEPEVYARHRRHNWDGIPWEQQAKSIARYYGACTFIDEHLGRMLDVLDRTGQADNTLVIFTSDHGDMLGAHGVYLKSPFPFEPAWRIPLVVRLPGAIPATAPVTDRFAGICDIAPTILRAAGAEVWGDAQGAPLQDVLAQDPPGEDRKSFYGEFHGGEYYFTQRIVWGLRYKLVFNTFAQDELYDLEEDPHEMYNRIDDSELSDVVKRMYRLYWKHHEGSDDFLDLKYPSIALFSEGPAGGQ